VLDGAAAQGQYQRVAGGQAGDGFVFTLAERGFAVAGEELGDGCTGLGLDYVIHIDEAPAQAGSDQRADGGLARAHEAGEDDAAGRGCGLGCGWSCEFSAANRAAFRSFQYREAAFRDGGPSAQNHHYGSGGDEQAADQDRRRELFAQ
jgi:hypothetical protein